MLQLFRSPPDPDNENKYVEPNIIVHMVTLDVVIFLDFHSTKQGQPLADSWSRGLDLNQMYLDLDMHGEKWRDRRREKLCQFSFS